MDIRNIGWGWSTPTNGINGIKSSVYHLSLPGTFYFLFPIISFFPAWSNNTYHILYDFFWKFVDINRLINASYSLVLLITVPLPCWCCEFSSLYSSSSFLFFVDFTFSIESSWSVRDNSSLSVRGVSVDSGLSSFASFLNYLNSGGNWGTCGGRL